MKFPGESGTVSKPSGERWASLFMGNFFTALHPIHHLKEQVAGAKFALEVTSSYDFAPRMPHTRPTEHRTRKNAGETPALRNRTHSQAGGEAGWPFAKFAQGKETQ